jgi:hypothetical protein
MRIVDAGLQRRTAPALADAARDVLRGHRHARAQARGRTGGFDSGGVGAGGVGGAVVGAVVGDSSRRGGSQQQRCAGREPVCRKHGGSVVGLNRIARRRGMGGANSTRKF